MTDRLQLERLGADAWPPLALYERHAMVAAYPYAYRYGPRA